MDADLLRKQELNKNVNVRFTEMELDIIDVFCNTRSQSRGQFIRYCLNMYVSSEKIMQMEEDARQKFAAEVNYEDSKKQIEYCECGKRAVYYHTCNEISKHMCEDCYEKHMEKCPSIGN